LHSLYQMPLNPEGKTVIVLADMLELGGTSRAAHDALIDDLRPLAPAYYLGLGPECSRLAELLRAEGWEAAGFSEGRKLANQLHQIAKPGDRVLFKGSHSFALEKVAQMAFPEARILADH